MAEGREHPGNLTPFASLQPQVEKDPSPRTSPRPSSLRKGRAGTIGRPLANQKSYAGAEGKGFRSSRFKVRRSTFEVRSPPSILHPRLF